MIVNCGLGSIYHRSTYVSRRQAKRDNASLQQQKALINNSSTQFGKIKPQNEAKFTEISNSKDISGNDSINLRSRLINWFVVNLTSNLFFGIIIALLLLVLSYLVNSLINNTSNARITSPSETSLSTITATQSTEMQTIYLNESSGSIQINQGQMLVVADYNGTAVVKFLFNQDGASYQWRYKPWEETKEETGSGLLYEHISWTPTDNGATGVDTGSLLAIKFGTMQIVWSRRSPTSGWLYYKNVGITLLNESGFDNLNLANIQMRR